MRMTLSVFKKMMNRGEKIAALTCYDASFAQLLEEAGVEILLVGDSLGMVYQGKETTLPVSLEAMCYHTHCVAQGSKRALIMADMPWGSYQENPQQAMRSGAQLLAAGCHMVKLEGGAAMAKTVDFLARRGVPVCGHIGLTPQSIHKLGGYRVQGRSKNEATQLMEDARLLEQAGAEMLVVEAVPAKLAKKITRQSSLPTIGIGAGIDCDGQVLVLYDVLGIYPGKLPRFVKNFIDGANSVQHAIEKYVRAVKARKFPAPAQSF